jgi:type II secretory pathway pseudopilin PulG
MNLQGQDSGYAMAALLVAIAVLTLMLSIAMPVWRHEMQREREAELVFRGEQYVRAIDLFQRKYPGTAPPSIDVLVSQKFLRKKYKDPVTEDGEFRIVYAGQQGQPTPGAPGQGDGARQPGAKPSLIPQGRGPRDTRRDLPRPGTPAGQPGAQPGFGVGGIIGVASKSKDRSILLYKGRNKYEEWPFIFANMGTQPGGPGGAPRPGLPGVGSPRPGQPGRPGQTRPGQPDRPGTIGPGLGRPPGTGRPPGQRPPGSSSIPRQ